MFIGLARAVLLLIHSIMNDKLNKLVAIGKAELDAFISN